MYSRVGEQRQQWVRQAGASVVLTQLHIVKYQYCTVSGKKARAAAASPQMFPRTRRRLLAADDNHYDGDIDRMRETTFVRRGWRKVQILYSTMSASCASGGQEENITKTKRPWCILYSTVLHCTAVQYARPDHSPSDRFTYSAGNTVGAYRPQRSRVG